MRTLRGLLALAVAIPGALVLSSAAAQAAAPTPPHTAFTVSSNATGWPLLGRTLAFDKSNATIVRATNPALGFYTNFIASDPDDEWQASFSPPTGTMWAAGTTYQVTGFPTATHAFFDITGNHSGCNGDFSGTLEIKEFALTADQQEIAVLAATFNTVCDSVPMIGEMRWNSAVDYRATAVEPSPLDFGNQQVGSPSPSKKVTLTAMGSLSTTLGTATVTAPFSITGNTCTGATLSYGQTCALTVRATPAQLGDAHGSIEIADNTASGKKFVRLLVTGGNRVVSVDPTVINFGLATVGQVGPATDVVLSVGGSVPTALSPAVVEGDFPGSFAVTKDDCAGQTIQPGQSCVVKVAARPVMGGTQTAVLVIAVADTSERYEVDLMAMGDAPDGTYFSTTPSRLLDTRTGVGAPAGAVGPGGTLTLQVAGRLDVPSWIPPEAASAVVLNVTATEPTASGHVTVYPTGVARPNASSLNFVPGWTGANSVTVALGTDGKVSLFNSAGNTHLIVDAVGYYVNSSIGGLGGQFFPVSPGRLYDSRYDSPGPLPAGSFVRLGIDFDPETNQHVRGLAINVTATGAGAAGYLTSWDSFNALPSVSTLNYGPGTTVPNMTIVPTINSGGFPTFGIFTSQTVHVIVDVVGFFDDGTIPGGLRFRPMTPTRITDTRTGQGLPGALGTAQTGTVTVSDQIIGADTIALGLNVTGVTPTVDTFLTVWAHGAPRPPVSNLNPARGQIIPNAAITGLDLDNQFNVYNNAGSTHVVIDVVGSFYFLFVPTPPGLSGTNSGTATRQFTRPAPKSFTLHKVT